MSIVSLLLLNNLCIVTIPQVVEMYHVVVHVKIRKESFLEVNFAMSIVFLSCQLVFSCGKASSYDHAFLTLLQFRKIALILHIPCMNSIQNDVSVVLNSNSRFRFFRQCRT
jgi:hypothetical protein